MTVTSKKLDDGDVMTLISPAVAPALPLHGTWSPPARNLQIEPHTCLIKSLPDP